MNMFSLKEIRSQSIISTAILMTFLCLSYLSCSKNPQDRLTVTKPGMFLWAWENREDLRFIDPRKIGVAFLAQSLFLRNDEVILVPRRQPLEVSPKTYLIAVTRIETKKAEAAPAFSDRQREKLVSLLEKTVRLPNVKEIQLDFDVVESERPFYRKVIIELRKVLPEDTELTITALASWCIGDRWFSDLPINEAVPMLFQMGRDESRIHILLAEKVDWKEPLCRKSYGLAIDEPLKIKLMSNRRRFYFKSGAWRKSDLQKLRR